MKDHRRNMWLALVVGGALGQVLGTYVVRLLDWAGPVAWAGLRAAGTSRAATPVFLGFVALYAVFMLWAFSEELDAGLRRLRDRLTGKHEHPPAPALAPSEPVQMKWAGDLDLDEFEAAVAAGTDPIARALREYDWDARSPGAAWNRAVSSGG